MSDSVKHPSHYAEGRKFEPKDVIRDWGLNFNLGSAVKYVARAGRKDDIVQDLKKAQEFIQFEIDAIVAEADIAKQKYPKEAEPKRDNLLYGLDPITRALVEAELCNVKPVKIKFSSDVDLAEFLKTFFGGV